MCCDSELPSCLWGWDAGCDFSECDCGAVSTSKLTFKIVVELERWHVPVHRHVSPRRPQWDGLFASSPGLPVLLRPDKTSRQIPVSDFKQVTGVISNPHWKITRGTKTLDYSLSFQHNRVNLNAIFSKNNNAPHNSMGLIYISVFKCSRTTGNITATVVRNIAEWYISTGRVTNWKSECIVLFFVILVKWAVMSYCEYAIVWFSGLRLCVFYALQLR